MELSEYHPDKKNALKNVPSSFWRYVEQRTIIWQDEVAKLSYCRREGSHVGEWWREVFPFRDALSANRGWSGWSVHSSCFNLESEGTLFLVVRLIFGTMN